VQIDHGSLEQSLLNMFVNARDAMNGSGSIRVRTLQLQHGEAPPQIGGPSVIGPHALLLIEDNGCGMSEEVLSRIFEPFFTTKGPGVGTGLGLAGAYATLTQAGGDIRVHSVEGEGTTFGLLLPGVPGVAPHPPVEETASAPRGTETILVAEDREQVRDLAKAILEALGYTVLTASNGEEALEVAEAHDGTIDLLLTDVIMPRMGGVELARTIQERLEGIAVVFMSGYPGKDLSATLPPSSERSVLRKPFTSSALGHRIRDALDEAS
ncbi:MAG: response regulator, partial [Planctomycetota bacterium]|nr:response regulator [Planctomycetota bacterium]